MKIFLTALFLWHSASLAADPVDDFIRSAMQEHHIPGLTIAVDANGKASRVTAYGLANVELSVPASAATVYEIGSVTKQFTSACILLLAQEGRLSVDDKIERYLQRIPPGWSNITIRHLLTHTSGIRNYTGQPGFEMARRLTQAQFIEALTPWPLDFAPGEKARYSNTGYNLLGFIVENISQKSYWSFLSERICSPLGMAATTNRDPQIVIRGRASGYLRNGGVLRNRDSDLTDVFSAGAIVSTVGDLLKWNAALDGGRLLHASTRSQMWTAVKLNNGEPCPYAFGWRIGEFQGRRNIGHSGSTSGFSASLQKFPDDALTIIVLCNSGEANIATTLARGIASLYFATNTTGKAERFGKD